MERWSDRFAATGDRPAGHTTCGNERIEAALAFDDKGITPEFEQQVCFFGPMGDEMLEVSSASWLVPFLLLVLQEQDSYGYELTWSMSDFDFGPRNPLVVYRALRQMEEEGMVVSEGDGFDGRLSYRRYLITGPGKACLEFWVNSLARYREKVDLFLRLYNEQPAL